MSAGLVLGIDTSTTVNVGLALGDVVLATATVTDSRAHVEQLMPLVRQCLDRAGRSLGEVDQLVVGLGPGPFTGLRVGIATAQVLALSIAVPLRGICSLDVIAAQHVAEGPAAAEFVAASDARRKEVYWARYAADGTRIDGPHVGAPETVPGLPTVGPAVLVHPDRLTVAPGPRVLDPGTLAVAGPELADVGTRPLYLRRADATEPTRRKPVLLRRPQSADRAGQAR